MEEIKTQGLILNSNKLNDNDKIFTVLTRDRGKLTALSKGISSHKHKDFSALQNFCYSDMVLSRKTGMYYISSANINNNFYDIRNSVEQVSFAAYICDVLRSMPEDMELDDVYYNFVLNTLFMIGKAQQKCSDGDIVTYLKTIKTVFEFKTVCNFGFMPNVESCGICSGIKDLKYFDITNGCVVCKQCFENALGSEYINIDDKTHNYLKFLCISDYKQVFFMKPDDFTVDTANEISEIYLQKCLEIYPASLEYLKSLISGSKD